MDVLVAILAGSLSGVLLVLGGALVFASWSSFVVESYLLSVLLAGIVAVWLRRRGHARGRAAASLRARRSMVSLSAVLTVGVGAALAASLVAIRPPKQAALAAWRQENGTRFERLRVMLEADRISGVLDYGSEYSRDGLPFATPDRAGLTRARAAEYQRLMRAAGCQRVDVWSAGTLSFFYRSWGTANRGWRVSLVRSQYEPSPLLPTIDGFPTTRSPGPNHAFSRLDGPWYAYIVW